MSTPTLGLVYFIYGLAFFCMGLLVSQEGGRGSDIRLRRALRPLAGFGLIHGIHEWLDMFLALGLIPFNILPVYWDAVRIGFLAFSFLSLSAFGASLLSENERIRRLSLLVPLVQVTIWGFGVFVMLNRYPYSRIWGVADVWSRYVLGIPASLIACLGLVAQQRAFRRAGMAQFGRDSLWAAIAFAWYGLFGQIFTRPSVLPPSTVVNQDLFLYWFGFPIQVFRAVAASVAAFFVVRFLQSSEVEQQSQIASLQAARLYEAQRRESLRGELLKRVVAAQERERQRVARELHDETGQALTALGLGLRGVASILQTDIDLAGRNLRQLENLATRSLDELQRLIADLRPSHLDDLGLPAALRWYGNDIQSRSGLKVRIDVVGSVRPVSAPLKIALFRIVQEALTNVLKHSKARQVCVRIRYGEHIISVVVKDNGIGFNPAQMTLQNRSSWGLLGMQERASLLNGVFLLRSRYGEGTTISVRIPYQQETISMDDFQADSVTLETAVEEEKAGTRLEDDFEQEVGEDEHTPIVG